ncbi:MAG: hypothetical protein WC777_00430 [Candidatus Gracilibacteria bacterium]|jgi:hypothetical protein
MASTNQPSENPSSEPVDKDLREADALLRKIAEKEGKQLTRLEKSELVGDLNIKITNLQKKITDDVAKAPDKQNLRKRKDWADRRDDLTEKRAEILKQPDEKADARIAEVQDQMIAEGKEAEAARAEIKTLTDNIAKWEAELAPLRSSQNPNDLERAANLADDIKAAKKDLERKTDGGKNEVLLDTRQRQAAELATKAEALRVEKEESAKADQQLTEDLESLDSAAEGTASTESAPAAPAEGTPPPEGTPPAPGETPPADSDETAPPTEGTETSEEPLTDEEKAALKKEVLNGAAAQVAHSLTLSLLDGKPDKDANMLEGFEWTMKIGLLKLALVFGGEPKWTQLLTQDQKDKLFADAGMVITQEARTTGKKAGQMRTIIKWEKVPEARPIPETMVPVFEAAFGKDEKAMNAAFADIYPETTVTNLRDPLPKPLVEAKDIKMAAFLDAMIAAGATPDTKIIEFFGVGGNAALVKNALPAAEVPAAEGETPAAEVPAAEGETPAEASAPAAEGETPAPEAPPAQ